MGMTHRALYKIVFCFIAITLVCFCLQSAALAATQLANDNHTDTVDYCMRAHDVTIGLSEFSSMTRAELESEIISKSGFLFRIRDSAPSFNDWTLVTSGYTVDFSALQEAETMLGYPVVVTLPVITPGVTSQITFRVFVVDDSPAVYQVSYHFISITPGKDLPAAILLLKPDDTVGGVGDIFTPPVTYEYGGSNGIWSFIGWDISSQTITDHDVLFVGRWARQANPEYNVEYQFSSASSSKSLPDEVLALLPSNTAEVTGAIITPQSTFSTVRGHAGYWQFSGWNVPSQTINDHDILFIGVWEWITLHYSAPTPTAEPSTPTPTMCLEVKITPAPVPTPVSNTPDWAIQIISNDNDNDNGGSDNNAAENKATGNTGSGIGDALKMAASLALTSILSIQVVGIAFDLRVLKWYKAKKAKTWRMKQ